MYHVLYKPVCTFMYHVLYFTLCTLTLRFQFFALFVTDHTRKQNLLINFVFIEDLPSVSQSNVQTVAAKNEEQYTLSNIIYIQFQNCWFFSFGVYFEEGASKK